MLPSVASLKSPLPPSAVSETLSAVSVFPADNMRLPELVWTEIDWVTPLWRELDSQIVEIDAAAGIEGEGAAPDCRTRHCRGSCR